MQNRMTYSCMFSCRLRQADMERVKIGRITVKAVGCQFRPDAEVEERFLRQMNVTSNVSVLGLRG
jgi:hypothetical protein